MLDIDKLITLATKLGIPSTIVLWLAYEVHRFVSALLENQANFLTTNQQIAQLLQRLLDMHTK